MEIKINIDESRFQEVLEKELEAFSKDEIHEILKQALSEYLTREDVIKSLLTSPQKDRWGTVISNSTLLDKLVAATDLNDVFAEPKEKIKEIIGSDEVLKSTAITLLAEIFKDRYKAAFFDDYNFINMLSARVANELQNKLR